MKSFGSTCFILIVALALAQCETFVYSSSSSNTNGNAEFHCKEVKCPENTTKCIATDKTTSDKKNIDYHRECQDSSGKLLHEVNYQKENPNPNQSVNNYVQQSNSVSSSNSGGTVNKSSSSSSSSGSTIVNSGTSGKNAIKPFEFNDAFWDKWQKNFDEYLQEQLKNAN